MGPHRLHDPLRNLRNQRPLQDVGRLRPVEISANILSFITSDEDSVKKILSSINASRPVKRSQKVSGLSLYVEFVIP